MYKAQQGEGQRPVGLDVYLVDTLEELAAFDGLILVRIESAYRSENGVYPDFRVHVYLLVTLGKLAALDGLILVRAGLVRLCCACAQDQGQAWGSCWSCVLTQAACGDASTPLIV